MQFSSKIFYILRIVFIQYPIVIESIVSKFHRNRDFICLYTHSLSRGTSLFPYSSLSQVIVNAVTFLSVFQAEIHLKGAIACFRNRIIGCMLPQTHECQLPLKLVFNINVAIKKVLSRNTSVVASYVRRSREHCCTKNQVVEYRHAFTATSTTFRITVNSPK